MVDEVGATLHLQLEQEIRDFGDRLREWGFADTSIGELIGRPGSDCARAEDLCLVVHRTSGDDPLGPMIRLFVMGLPVAIAELDRTIDPGFADVLSRLGLVSIRQGNALATVKIQPYRSVLCAYDPPTRRRFPGDYVMGPAQSSNTLAQLTVRRSIRRALDLCCGCGVHALLAAAHSDSVVAVDSNPRAAMFTGFNALLNGIETIDVRIGDMFSPIEGERFDLVATNPPFVISPETTYTYRDSPETVDGVARSVAERVGSILEAGGYCSMICNWAHLADGDWESRVRSWFSRAGCDVLVVRIAETHPEAYASNWIGHTEFGSIDERLEKYARWLDYYREHRIEQIDDGVIVIRKRDGPDGWFEVRESPGRMLGLCGADIERFFAVQDWLRNLGGPERLLDARLKLSPRAELEQTFEVSDRGWATRQSTLRIRDGLMYEGEIEEVVAELLPAFNGRRPAHILLAKLAEMVGSDTEELAPRMLRVLRAMIEQGVLDPV